MTDQPGNNDLLNLAPLPAGAQAAGAGGGQAVGAGGQAQGAQAQAQAEVTDVALARLAAWKGNGKDSTTIELWIDQVERMATQKGWNNERTAAAVCDALKENAARWMAVMKANPDRRRKLSDWALLKPALNKRFADSLTAAQKQSFARGLVQAPNEAVQDFYDRVAFALAKVHEDHREHLAGIELDGQKLGYDKSTDVGLGSMFVTGLRPEIREYVECNMKERADSESLLELAVKSESSKGLGATSASLKLAALDDSYEPSNEWRMISNELAEIKTRMNTFSAGAGRGRGRGKATTPLPAFKDRKTWFYCYKCRQHGLHVSKECRLNDDQKARLTPQPRFPLPTSTPTDAQFPNGM